jgi:hypothetical protein
MDSDSDSEESSNRLSLSEEPTLTSKSFALPKNYDALSLLNDTEQVHTFAHKSNSKIERQKLAPSSDHADKSYCSSLSKKLATRRKIRDMQVLGCLIMELFFGKNSSMIKHPRTCISRIFLRVANFLLKLEQ